MRTMDPATSSVGTQSSSARSLTSCSTPLPIVVATENLTDARGDLCVAFNRSIQGLAGNSAFATQTATLAVSLVKLERSPETSCRIRIVVQPRSGSLAFIDGGAKVNASNDAVASRECIESVIGDLMSKQVVPLMQQPAAVSTPTAGGSSAASSPTSFPYRWQ
ncbi:hypothetical protein BH11MYX2_BH11MYX2_30300 [soil metagenome]